MVRHIDVDKNARWGKEELPIVTFFFVAQIKIKLYFMRLMKLFRMNKIFVVEWKICLNTGTAFWQCGNITTGVFVIIIFKRGSM